MMKSTRPEISRRCPACETENNGDAAHCIACGHALPARDAAPATPAAAAGYAVAPQATRVIGKREFSLKTDLPPNWRATRIEPTAPLETVAAAVAANAPPPATPAAAPAAVGAGGGAPQSQQNPFFDQTAFTAGNYPPAWYDVPPEPARRRLGAIWIACIFAIGVASGAAGYWWLQPPPAATANPEPRPTNSAGELPYDGAAAATATAATRPTEASAPAEKPVPIERPAPVEGPVPAAGAGAPEPSAPAPVAAAVSQPEGAAAAVSAGADDAAPTPAPAPARAARRHRKTRAAGTSAAAQPAADTGQAGATRSGEPSLTPLMLAQCARMTDADERRECRREVCNGKWGEHGCPPAPAAGAAE